LIYIRHQQRHQSRLTDQRSFTLPVRQRRNLAPLSTTIPSIDPLTCRMQSVRVYANSPPSVRNTWQRKPRLCQRHATR